MPPRPRKTKSARPRSAKSNAGGFQQRPADAGLPLDEMSQALAERLARGAAPYEEASPDPGSSESPSDLTSFAAQVAASSPPAPSNPEDDACEITPRSILEAMLFVGHPENEPLRPEQVAELMRGVRPAEIDDLVQELNDEYRANRCPYAIESHGGGYLLTLTNEHLALRERIMGRTRRARLSQAAIETLAAVAYHQPITADRVGELRGVPCGAVLSQLVRRQLLEVRRDEGQRQQQYITAPRFLEFFGLESLEDLPRGQDLEAR